MPTGRSPVAGRTRNEASGKKLAAARQQHDVAQEFHSSGFAAVLVVDFAVHVIGVGQLNQSRRGFEGAIAPGSRRRPRESGCSVSFASASGSSMNWRVCSLKYCERKHGIEFGAEGHELRFDALQARRGVQRGDHFGDQCFW